MMNLLTLRETSSEQIHYLLDTALSFVEIINRPVKKVPNLRGRVMVTLFYENSTRTRTSFEVAAKIMSAEAINVAIAQSSVSKGESLKDTLRTIQALKADCIVIRHSSSGTAQFAADHLQIPVINAGDGRHEHPTQGLLDMLTIQKHKGDLRGLKVAIVGDVAHSRVARSNIWGLTKMGASVTLVGPSTLMPQDVSELPVTVSSSLKQGLEGADVVNVLRLQTERQERGLLPSLREYSKLFGINSKTVRYAKPDVMVLHPGPMNRGVEITAEVADGINGVHSAIEEQVSHGIAVRMAALYMLMSVPSSSVAQQMGDRI